MNDEYLEKQQNGNLDVDNAIAGQSSPGSPSKESVQETPREKQVFTTRRMLPPGKVDYYFSIDDKRVKTKVKRPVDSNHNKIKAPKLNYILNIP